MPTVRERAEAEWDYYREIYRRLSFKDKKLLHEFWYRRFPVQKGYVGDLRFFVSCVGKVIKREKRPRTRVLEYGGREGGLAYEILKKYPKLNWVNAEIITHEQLPGLEKHTYMEYVLSNELWHERPKIGKRDVFLSCNTLEHINGNQIHALFNYLKAQKTKYLILRVSTSPKGKDWKGYMGSHILRMGTTTMKRVLRRKGYYLLEQRKYEKDVSYLKGWCSFWLLKA